ncbi:hypothetical protein [Sphingobacterium mizutaii]|uniref:hypothetical protein n=1 Tax=Sphingobacterium mizutaii TaxID=1010 RepID=UPI00162A4515|nr:hypothetical protein [Sphingobacterium mizutaii]
MNRKQLTREIIILLASALMFITGISALLVAGFDFLSISLNPQTWGTISDWIIVLITIITAILLLLTLDSQRQVQENQSRLAEIEINRFRDEFIPSFNSTSHLSIEKINDIYFLTTTIHVYKNKCKDFVFFSNYELEISVENRKDYHIIPSTNTKHEIKKNYEYKLNDIILWDGAKLHLKIKFNLIKYLLLKNDDIIIFFKDIKGYKYNMSLKINHSHNNLDEYDRQYVNSKISEIEYL